MVMLNIPSVLQEYSLTTDDSLVICSGILNALNLRESHDIDLVVNDETYKRLKKDSRLRIVYTSKYEMLQNEILEISNSWDVREWDINYTFEDLKKDSIIIDNVRYISLEFLLRYKQLLATNPNPRKKDLNDIKIIEEYLRSQ